MLQELKKAKLIRYNNELKKGFYVTQERKLKEIDFEKLEDVEVLKYIFENGEEKKAFDISSQLSNIFEYTISNGGSYEFAESTSLYSTLFITHDEFKEMVRSVVTDKCHDVWSVSVALKEKYPNIFVKMGFGTGACTCEWACHECSDPLR